jgi:alkanesulfonate monooxygenase SsuD/methylene tetrahydromethanopterin reductase-like flavin-dependent oxidoreductase (luciferase family)
MRVCLMIEGQEDVGWEDWVAIARACEEHGIEALFRSDHYIGLDGESTRGALDAWGTLCGLAAITSQLRLGTLVSPATFRHPAVLAKLAVTADHISGGRVEVGMGAGWHEREHALFGFEFPPPRERMARLEAQLETVHRQWESGEHLFQPVQEPHPPLIMGGSAGPRSAALAARWADEYNTVYVLPDEARRRRDTIAAACEAAGREPIGFSIMNGFLIGADDAELRERERALVGWNGSGPGDTWLTGRPEQIVERLREYEAAGVQRVMMQHLLHRDLDAIALLGREVVPAVSS